jgi:hypothetical protein
MSGRQVANIIIARFLKMGLNLHGMWYEMTILTGEISYQVPLKIKTLAYWMGRYHGFWN